MRLSSRLKTIADLVPVNHRLADVGTDHAYIPVYLKKNGHIAHIIASDINEGPLNNAKETICDNNLKDQIETRLGGGLEPYHEGEIDTVIIAGMGGLLIGQILQTSNDIARNVKQLILQPMQAQDELRKWLNENEYVIKKEILSKEGRKYYEILVVETGETEIKDEIYNEIGYLLPKNNDPLFLEFLTTKIRKYETIFKSVENESSEGSITKKAECQKKLKQLKEVKSCVLTREKS